MNMYINHRLKTTNSNYLNTQLFGIFIQDTEEAPAVIPTLYDYVYKYNIQYTLIYYKGHPRTYINIIIIIFIISIEHLKYIIENAFNRNKIYYKTIDQKLNF